MVKKMTPPQYNDNESVSTDNPQESPDSYSENERDVNMLADQDKSNQENIKNKIPSILQKYIESLNIVEELDDDVVSNIGHNVIANKEVDEESRLDWKQEYEEALKIAKQIYETKTEPWQNASNVKYPMILTACVQFNARTNPEITQNDRVVYVDIMKENVNEDDEDRAIRLGAHMSYQLLGQSDHWRSDTDKLLMILPLVGTVFRKSWYDHLEENPDTQLCLPEDILVNQNVSSLEKAPRITHKYYMTINEIIERMRYGMFIEIPLEDLMITDDDEDKNKYDIDADDEDDIGLAKSHLILEQHCFIDLDDDGYEEPYIVVVHAETQRVLRIVARYNYDSFVFKDNKKQFIKIKPTQYFTDYHFIPSPDGEFYSLGFGKMLYPLNQSVNTLLNQLIDAGTLSNLQGGFIKRGLRSRKHDIDVKMGEWNEIETGTTGDLSRDIVPFPVKEPSSVLFNLLEMLIKAGEEIATVSNVMQGQPPGSNVPATTVLSLIEQGTKVFSSILYRLYGAFKKEFEKLFELNKMYLSGTEFFKNSVSSGMIKPEDYQIEEAGVFPVADPGMSTDAQRMARAQALMSMLQIPGINQHEIISRWLVALKVPNPEKILPPPPPEPPTPPPPSPEEEKVIAETNFIRQRTAELMARLELDAIKVENDANKNSIDAEKVGADAAALKIKTVNETAQVQAELGSQQLDQASKTQEMIEGPTQMISQGVMDRMNALEQRISSIVGVGPQDQNQQDGLQQQQPQGSVPPPDDKFGGMQMPSPEQEQAGQAGIPQTPSIGRELENVEGD